MLASAVAVLLTAAGVMKSYCMTPGPTSTVFQVQQLVQGRRRSLNALQQQDPSCTQLAGMVNVSSSDVSDVRWSAHRLTYLAAFPALYPQVISMSCHTLPASAVLPPTAFVVASTTSSFAPGGSSAAAFGGATVGGPASSTLSGGAIAGIVVGVICGIVILAALSAIILFLQRRRWSPKEVGNANGNAAPSNLQQTAAGAAASSPLALSTPSNVAAPGTEETSTNFLTSFFRLPTAAPASISTVQQQGMQAAATSSNPLYSPTVRRALDHEPGWAVLGSPRRRALNKLRTNAAAAASLETTPRAPSHVSETAAEPAYTPSTRPGWRAW